MARGKEKGADEFHQPLFLYKGIGKYKILDAGRCLAPSAIGSSRSVPHCGGDSLLGGTRALFADRQALCAFLIVEYRLAM
ncbi:hypothetical protein CA592_09215 [Anoxybacillus flavithermus]|nr:hypothetical protein CA592_09215 [Anoxybacillus flavithermus]